MSAKLTITIPEWLDKICTWPLMVYRRMKYGYSYRRIYLGQGEWTILDAEDYYRFSDFKWGIYASKGKRYVVCNIKIRSGRTRVARLHREIMNAPPGLLVDHRNSVGLDNRRENLRLATRAQNSCNRRKTKSKTSSRFIGVCFHKRHQRWYADIRHNGKKIWLGSFASEIDAARAHDKAVLEYHGEFARLNFPEEMCNSPSANKSRPRRGNVQYPTPNIQCKS